MIEIPGVAITVNPHATSAPNPVGLEFRARMVGCVICRWCATHAARCGNGRVQPMPEDSASLRINNTKETEKNM
ncbi:MAG: hypothetical protein WCI01_12500 [Chlorobiaceae bacterium]